MSEPKPDEKGTPGADPAKNDAIPYARFKEVIEAKNTLEQKTKDLEAKLDKIEEERLEKEGEKDQLLVKYKQEVEELRPYKEKASEIEKERRQELLDRLPEDDRADFETVPLDVLRTVVKKFGKVPKVPPVDGSPSQPPEKYGGYESVEVWAKKDPRSFRKARKEGLI